MAIILLMATVSVLVVVVVVTTTEMAAAIDTGFSCCLSLAVAVSRRQMQTQLSRSSIRVPSSGLPVIMSVDRRKKQKKAR